MRVRACAGRRRGGATPHPRETERQAGSLLTTGTWTKWLGCLILGPCVVSSGGCGTLCAVAVRLVTHVSDEVYAAVRGLAERDGRSLSQACHRLLAAALGLGPAEGVEDDGHGAGRVAASREQRVGGTQETRGPVSRYFDR